MQFKYGKPFLCKALGFLFLAYVYANVSLGLDWNFLVLHLGLFGLVEFVVFRRPQVRFRIVSWNVMWDSRLDLEHPLSQPSRLPGLLAHLRQLKCQKTHANFANPDAILLQEVHESSLPALRKFAHENGLNMVFALYNDLPHRRWYLVTFSPHCLQNVRFCRVPEGFNYHLKTRICIGHSAVDVCNVHFPLDLANEGPRQKATQFACQEASGLTGDCRHKPFWLWWLSFFQRLVVAGDWNTLPEAGRGAQEQLRTAEREGVVSVSTKDPAQFFDGAVEVLLSLAVSFAVAFWGGGVFVPGVETQLLVFLGVSVYLTLSGPVHKRPVFQPTFFGYPVEEARLQGLQLQSQLDHVGVSPGLRLESFQSLWFPVVGQDGLKSFHEQQGLDPWFHDGVSLTGGIPASDHLATGCTLDVGVSLAGRWVRAVFACLGWTS
mmetsp:Transcript_4027/g.6196  ORF Transcript_4027/g.6196 Transcript_4027/m.6196 type:complete len:434 (+) Transcript_4027:227-1528(+)